MMRERDATTTAARIERAIWPGLPGSHEQEAYRYECVGRVLEIMSEDRRQEHDRLRNQIAALPAPTMAVVRFQRAVLALLGESTKEAK